VRVSGVNLRAPDNDLPRCFAARGKETGVGWRSRVVQSRVEKTLEFADLLRLMQERSTAFQAAVAAAPSLDVRVPTCPEWTLLDLVQHLVEGRHKWAAIVAAGPADAPAAFSAPAAPREREAPLTWFAASVRELLDALREAGPDRGCWTWWDTSQSPQTSGAVARHQLQQLAVHTYDAQVTVGTPQPLHSEVALDGVDEFLTTCCAGTEPWPHEPVVVDYHATEGRSWRLRVSDGHTRVTRLPYGATAGEDREPADVAAWGTAHELVMFFYGRIPTESLHTEGNQGILDQLHA
jgi:uncharacterized protein (TIGR03083 family)